MVMSVPVNTYNALVNAHINGIVPRDFVWIRARNRETGEFENIGLWNGKVPVTVQVVRPGDGVVITRTYQGVGNLMQVPPIPMGIKLEVRTVSVAFSNLTPEILNAVLAYNVKDQSIQIHRGLLDPATMNLVDPAICRLDGVINKAPYRRAKSGAEGKIVLACQSHARTLDRGNPAKLSDEFFKRRGARMPYLDVVPKITWGQKDVVHEGNGRKPGKWIR